MLVLFPAIFFFTTSIAVNRYFKAGRRISLLVSAVLTGTVLTFMTEILSLFHSFSFYPIAWIWCALTIVSLGLALPVLRSSLKEIHWGSKALSFDEQFLIYLIEAILVITAITAVASIPNTWDSMTYHLSRVEHWIQNRTIAYYPTNIIRQLYFCPWAEFALAHLRLLCPWEPVVNLLQWFSMAGSLVCVSLIARQLGGSRRAQLIACLAAVMLPMGILQSVSTQTDYVETLWLLCFIFFVNETRRHFRLLYIISAGLGLGLALLTKGYGYILMVPFAVLFIVSIPGPMKRIKAVCIMVLCVLVLNIGYYERNQSAFGSLTLGKEDLANSSFDLKVLLGGLIRNIGVEIDTPFRQINNLIPMGLAKTSNWLGNDSIYDPHPQTKPSYFQDYRRSESYSGNFLHMFLFMAVLLLCWIMPKQGQGLRLYTVLFCCAGILFCLVIHYQDWVSRFHLPIFIMFSPVFGVFMDRTLSPGKTVVLGELFFLNALFFLFFNAYHPWFGPANIWRPNNDRYFIARPTIMHNYTGMAGQIRALGCHEVGIISGPDAWEYPLWVLLRDQRSKNDFRIEHLFVKNRSAPVPYPLGNFEPCAVVEIKEKTQGTAILNGQYRKIWGSQDPDGYKTGVYVPIR